MNVLFDVLKGKMFTRGLGLKTKPALVVVDGVGILAAKGKILSKL